MQINKIGSLYIARGHYQNTYITASGSSLAETLANLFKEIAIQRSLLAWNK